MEKTVIQCNIFTAMLANGNHHFLNEACMLLKRERNTTDVCEKVAYDKLLELVKRIDKKEIKNFLKEHNIQYLCK